jgi:hypothetical protein
MADLAKLEAEALTALRQYQEALAKELLAFAPNGAGSHAKKEAIEQFVISANEAANIARQWQHAQFQQNQKAIAIAKAVLAK